ncbi:MAG: PEP/pyruvate-binding domain-containing protein [Bdellovibrionota bacterium]|nr:PEP/pyruvate-binding domain-containing protein [Bdellovibrionota bacterium]
MILNASDNFDKFHQYAGGKATSLKRLYDCGLNVPHFYVVDTRLFEQYISSISKEIEHLISLGELAKIREIIENLDLVLPSKTENYSLYSVRSSANLEDGANQSFAGIYESFLHLAGSPETHIKKCWASIFTNEHFTYLQANNISWKQIKMAVIVQEMIVADFSGILFQANPNGNINEKVLVLGTGDGEGIVNATTETTTFYFDIFQKKFHIQNDLKLIPIEKVEKVIEQAKNYTDGINLFFDFEFCLKGNEIYFLQARPITTVSQNNHIEFFDSSNIAENYPGLSTPFTLSNLQRMYGINLSELLKYLKLPANTIKRLEPDLYRSIDSFCGRPYYLVNTWYSLLNSLPFFHRFLTSSWDMMIGVKQAETINTKSFSLSERVKLITQTLPIILRHFFSPKKYEDIYQHSFKSYHDWLKNLDFTVMTYNELLDVYAAAEVRYFSFARLALLNDLIVGLHLKILSVLTNNNPQLIGDLSNQNPEIESYKLVLSVEEIQKYIGTDESLKKEVYEAKELSDISNKELRLMLEKHLDLYGDRTIEEMKLETPSQREDPKQFFQYISSLQLKEPHTSKAIKPKLYFFKNILFKYFSRLYLESLAFRELSRFNRVRVKNFLRSILLECGEKLEKEKLISGKSDIFFFTEGEFLRPWAKQLTDKIDVKKRKETQEEFQNISLPTRFFLNQYFKPEIVNPAFREKNRLNQGIGCSPGIVRAECIVLESAQIGLEIKGKILVTKTTDPGWVFLMMQASGVIVENGNILSHAAIVGREMGIPTIIDFAGATKQFKTGSLLEMNGSTGQVTEIK